MDQKMTVLFFECWMFHNRTFATISLRKDQVQKIKETFRYCFIFPVASTSFVLFMLENEWLFNILFH